MHSTGIGLELPTEAQRNEAVRCVRACFVVSTTCAVGPDTSSHCHVIRVRRRGALRCRRTRRRRWSWSRGQQHACAPPCSSAATSRRDPTRCRSKRRSERQRAQPRPRRRTQGCVHVHFFLLLTDMHHANLAACARRARTGGRARSASAAAEAAAAQQQVVATNDVLSSHHRASLHSCCWTARQLPAPRTRRSRGRMCVRAAC